MQNFEVIEKKNTIAKAETKDLDFGISPEESKAVYLKKIDAANGSSSQLGELSITYHDGQAITTVAQKKDLAVQEEQVIADKIRHAKLADAKFEDKTSGDLDFSVGVSLDEVVQDKLMVKQKEAAANQAPRTVWERTWDTIAAPFTTHF